MKHAATVITLSAKLARQAVQHLSKDERAILAKLYAEVGHDCILFSMYPTSFYYYPDEEGYEPEPRYQERPSFHALGKVLDAVVPHRDRHQDGMLDKVIRRFRGDVCEFSGIQHYAIEYVLIDALNEAIQSLREAQGI